MTIDQILDNIYSLPDTSKLTICTKGKRNELDYFNCSWII